MTPAELEALLNDAIRAANDAQPIHAGTIDKLIQTIRDQQAEIERLRAYLQGSDSLHCPSCGAYKLSNDCFDGCELKQ